MESEALRFAAALENASEGGDPTKLTAQLEGRFRFLWGIYRAHSEVCVMGAADVRCAPKQGSTLLQLPSLEQNGNDVRDEHGIAYNDFCS